MEFLEILMNLVSWFTFMMNEGNRGPTTTNYDKTIVSFYISWVGRSILNRNRNRNTFLFLDRKVEDVD